MNDLYQNYLSRKPGPFGERLVKRWHQRIARHAAELLQFDWASRSCAEIGPGRGYFAEYVESLGCEYRFTDNSDPVINAMIANGFRLVEPKPHSFDVIWLSHVLEHSTDWMAARRLLEDSKKLARPGGVVVVVGPDYLNWGKRFFDTDATHGYPTTLRSVAQLMRDIGINVLFAEHHRGGRFRILPRAVFALIALFPISLGRVVLARRSLKSDDHPFYSWKAVLGWRQILVIGLVDN